MTPSIWCVFIVCNRIKNKCKEAYLYVTTVSNRFQNYLDPDCSSRTRVATDMKLFPDSDEIENRILTLAPFVHRYVQTGTKKTIPYWHKHDSKKVLNLNFLKYFSGIWWSYLNLFSAIRIILTLFERKHEFTGFVEWAPLKSECKSVAVALV